MGKGFLHSLQIPCRFLSVNIRDEYRLGGDRVMRKAMSLHGLVVLLLAGIVTVVAVLVKSRPVTNSMQSGQHLATSSPTASGTGTPGGYRMLNGTVIPSNLLLIAPCVICVAWEGQHEPDDIARYVHDSLGFAEPWAEFYVKRTWESELSRMTSVKGGQQSLATPLPRQGDLIWVVGFRLAHVYPMNALAGAAPIPRDPEPGVGFSEAIVVVPVYGGIDMIEVLDRYEEAKGLTRIQSWMISQIADLPEAPAPTATP